ncbi:MAG: metallophosphoesterase N-terminal domain-containing protein [Methylocella sp.]
MKDAETTPPNLSRRDLIKATALTATLAATGAPIGDLAAQEQPHNKGSEIVKGIVFETSLGLVQRPAGDAGIGGVLVSNGRDVARTGPDGRYSLPIENGMAVFVIKPAGYAVPLEPVTRLPRFSYIYQPDGTPVELGLLYPGLSPTGPLPESVDFGLIKTEEPASFDVVLFTDPQPESQAEVDFIRDDVVNGLIGVKAAFGLTAGDLMFDDLSFYDRYNKIIAQIGLPWWNIGGNHDLNFEAPDARYSRETFKRIFGANYYAFEYGKALFLMLDNVDYLGGDPAKLHSKARIGDALASGSSLSSPTCCNRPPPTG